ncbi:MAG: MBL fold metallo-hydrolase [Acidobacteria bacterium]|nr:MBL fold metallo-hydrolase [Acidobacteriota bacterium]
MFFRRVTDNELAQYAYLIGCQRTGEAIIFDPERDIDRYVELARRDGLRIVAAAETHIHADFLSGARQFASQHGVKLYLSSEGGSDWQSRWASDGDYDVCLLKDGDVFGVGNIEFKALHTPGHTPEHMAFLVTDRGGNADTPMGILSGDFVFVGDLGRPDLLETAAGVTDAMRPSAERLHASTAGFLELPDHLQVWPAHGAGSACGKALGAVPVSTVGYERRYSPALASAQGGVDAFVDFILADQPEPPLYFARMKALNRDGAPVLDGLPKPPHVAIDELGAADTVVLDTRGDRATFMAGHLAGSVYAPLDKSFPTIAGSYVEPEREGVFLVIGAADVDRAVRQLVRIGIDDIRGFVEPTQLSDAALSVIPRVDFASAASMDGSVLDVRRASEFNAGHVAGAVNVAHTRLIPRLGEVPSEGPVLVHCRSGARASSAASFLARRGFDAVHVDDNYADGVMDTPQSTEATD